jgi:hypothetical protein
MLLRVTIVVCVYDESASSAFLRFLNTANLLIHNYFWRTVHFPAIDVPVAIEPALSGRRVQ